MNPLAFPGRPGVWYHLSHIPSPLPSTFHAPSIWYAIYYISFSFRFIFSPDVASPHAIGNGWLCDLTKEDDERARAIKDTRFFICFDLWQFFLEG